MIIAVDVTTADGAPLPAGTPVRVELRDTSRADAAAETIASATARVGAERPTSVAVEVELPRPCAGCTVWAHADVDEDGAVSVGDLITMESFPVSPSQPRIRVTVREVPGPG